MKYLEYLDKISYSNLFVLAVLLGFAPFFPQPHVWEKLRLLKNGELTKWLDIFDLGFHLFPSLIIALKYYVDSKKKQI
jgi:hypothetical protein